MYKTAITVLRDKHTYTPRSLAHGGGGGGGCTQTGRECIWLSGSCVEGCVCFNLRFQARSDGCACVLQPVAQQKNASLTGKHTMVQQYAVWLAKLSSGGEVPIGGTAEWLKEDY